MNEAFTLYLTALPASQTHTLRTMLPAMLYASQTSFIVFLPMYHGSDEVDAVAEGAMKQVAANLLTYVIQTDSIPVGWGHIFVDALRRFAEWIDWTATDDGDNVSMPHVPSRELMAIADNISTLLA